MCCTIHRDQVHEEGSEVGLRAYMHTVSQIGWRLWSAGFICILGKGIDDIRLGFLGKTLPNRFESDSSGVVAPGLSIDDCQGNKAFRPFRIIGNRTSRVGKNR